ncbi:MAG: hypothetical protein IRY95_02785 [Clostridia bacterium]|nr:hypothetical protein [Clostridia bacterium]
MATFRVDSYRFLPRSFRERYEAFPEQPGAPAPAAPRVLLSEARVSLLTTAGLYLRDSQPPFDLERERREPFWGDPTYRVIPRTARTADIGVAHLHINPDDILRDMNVALPIEVFAELERDGVIGSLADRHYSFMGYQGGDIGPWRDVYGPELARLLREDGVDLLILAPA